MHCSITYLTHFSPHAGTFRELQATGLDFTKLMGDHNTETEEEIKEETDLMRHGSIKSLASIEVDAPKQVFYIYIIRILETYYRNGLIAWNYNIHRN